MFMTSFLAIEMLLNALFLLPGWALPGPGPVRGSPVPAPGPGRGSGEDPRVPSQVSWDWSDTGHVTR